MIKRGPIKSSADRAAAVIPVLLAGLLAFSMPIGASHASKAAGSAPPTAHWNHEPFASTSVSRLAAPDTVAAGDVFIVQLPDSLSGIPISRYTATRLPLRSWLLEKSFFWETTDEDRGRHAFDLNATPDTDTGSADAIPFTLHVLVR